MPRIPQLQFALRGVAVSEFCFVQCKCLKETLVQRVGFDLLEQSFELPNSIARVIIDE